MFESWNPATLWWLAAGIAVVAELASGSFYLLMVAFGLAAGAIAAHLGAGGTAQVVIAALISGGATALWYLKRSRHPKSAAARENHDVNIDIGEEIRVDAWSPERTARVVYRGSTWLARLAPGAPAAPGRHRVSAVEGNWLVLSPLEPAA
ncbi:NfeD family protein [Piscinibacter sakaiensis]|uniref:NfeD family protein n=1 Tax=Piscinibacter sakaiensis TaxID=1547922 RepID=UPI003AADF6C3